MDFGLKGKVAVVTGASRGIGRAVVDELLDEGVLVVAAARDVRELAQLPILALPVDLSTPEGPGKLIQAAIEEHGGIDFLINNVGAGRIHTGGFTSITDEDWDFNFQINLMSTVRAVRAAIPSLVQRHGVIVNVSSMNAQLPEPVIPEYSAMKAALNNLTGALAKELAKDRVRVISVSPGPILTDMQIGPGGVAEQVGLSEDQLLAEVNGTVPLGRFGAPTEVAATIVALLSVRLGYITGTDIAIDGGLGVR